MPIGLPSVACAKSADAPDKERLFTVLVAKDSGTILASNKKESSVASNVIKLRGLFLKSHPTDDFRKMQGLFIGEKWGKRNKWLKNTYAT